MAAHRIWSGLLVASTIALAATGEILVLTHTAGALGLILLAGSAAAGLAAWVALASPIRRADIRA